jgi:hypothetical protein
MIVAFKSPRRTQSWPVLVTPSQPVKGILNQIFFREVDNGFSGAHGHRVLLADDATNVKVARGSKGHP